MLQFRRESTSVELTNCTFSNHVVVSGKRLQRQRQRRMLSTHPHWISTCRKTIDCTFSIYEDGYSHLLTLMRSKISSVVHRDAHDGSDCLARCSAVSLCFLIFSTLFNFSAFAWLDFLIFCLIHNLTSLGTSADLLNLFISQFTQYDLNESCMTLT